MNAKRQTMKRSSELRISEQEVERPAKAIFYRSLDRLQLQLQLQLWLRLVSLKARKWQKSATDATKLVSTKLEPLASRAEPKRVRLVSNRLEPSRLIRQKAIETVGRPHVTPPRVGAIGHLAKCGLDSALGCSMLSLGLLNSISHSAAFRRVSVGRSVGHSGGRANGRAGQLEARLTLLNWANLSGRPKGKLVASPRQIDFRFAMSRILLD